MSNEREEQFAVVINQEEQYSIWPTGREPPLGWSSTGKVGTKQECLDYVAEVWREARPSSLRKLAGGQS